MEQDKEYFVFISYSSMDNEWAIWLRHELEHYHLPASFNGRTDVRDNLRKVFRDRDELSAGPEWDEQVRTALENTNNLIVICSPNSAKSPAVNKEIETFIALGKEDHIFPFIVEGDKPKDCFPLALRHSKLGGDVNKDGGRDSAFIKVVAGMLKVSFPSLWNRYEIEKAEEERKIREQRDKLLIMQSRFLAEKANTLVKEGDSYTARLLALEALPKDLEIPDRPYVIEAEAALRKSCLYRTAILKTSHNVRKAIFHPSKDIILSFAQDDEILLWNIASGEIMFKLDGHNLSISSASFSPNGKMALTSGADGTMRVWDIENGQCTKVIKGHFSQTITVQGQDIMDYYSICSAVWSPQGDKILSVSFVNSTFCVAMWDVATGECIRMLSDSLIGSFAYFAPSGNYFVTADVHDKIVSIWDANSFKCIKKMVGHRDQITSAKYSPDGNSIISASCDKTIRVWDVSTGSTTHIFSGHSEAINDVSFSNDGNWIVSASNDKTVRIWDMESGKCLQTLVGHDATVNSASFSPDDHLAISASEDKSIRIWNFSFKEDDKHLNSSIKKTGFIVASPVMNLIAYPMEPNVIGIWDIKSQSLRGKLRGHTDMVISVGFCPRHKIIVTTSKDGTIRFWSAENMKCLKVFDNFCGQTEVISFNKEESLLMVTIYTGGDYENLSVFDIASQKLIETIQIPDSNAIAISHDNKKIAIGNLGGINGNTISILDKDGKCLMKLAGHQSFINTIEFSSDGQFLVSSSSDKTTKLWNIQTGGCLLTLFGIKPSFLNNQTICISTPQNNLKCFDFVIGGPTFETEQCDYPIINYAFMEGNRKIAVIYKNGKIRYWDYSPLQQLINQTNERFKNRELAPEERKKYYLD